MVNINDSLAVKPKSKRIFYFDALRAMAIIAVNTVSFLFTLEDGSLKMFWEYVLDLVLTCS